ncbi:MAG: hypothetical protein A2Y86_02450 [Candidatus Aminicenantes bacterium RBG_13_62_12]|nr:MAG: hypothetical protein A2Y86_02450 [Candidatus Aminicenantes bacterium RBG_13_62_12]
MRFLSPEVRPFLERGEILELVLLDGEGMVLDAEGAHFPPEQLAAFFSPLHGLLTNIRQGLNIEAFEEISVRTLGPRMRVILQPFSAQESPYLLIALYPITTFYRQVTTDIVRIVKDCIRKLSSHQAAGYDPAAPPKTGRKEP